MKANLLNYIQIALVLIMLGLVFIAISSSIDRDNETHENQIIIQSNQRDIKEILRTLDGLSGKEATESGKTK